MQDGSQSIQSGSPQAELVLLETPVVQKTNFAVEYQTPEQQQQETQVDAPETVEVEGQQVPINEVDNPKSYKFFQSKFTKEQEEKQKILEDKIRLEERLRLLEEQKLPPKGQAQNQIQEPPKKPQRPVKPQDYNRLDATTEPNSPSARYDEAFQDYLEAKEVYDEYDRTQLVQKIQSYEQEKQKIAEKEQLAQVKASQLQRFQEAGIAPEKAAKVYDFVMQAFQKDDPTWYERLYDIANSTPTPQAQRTVTQFENRGQRQNQPLPPGVAPSEAAPTGQQTFDGDLLQFTKLNRI
jgi:hypothetical protein